MSKQKNTEFGLREQDNDNKDKRAFSLTNHQWCDILHFVYVATTNGAAPMLYTSADRAALCISVKHGNNSRKYWIGPSDDPADIIDTIYREWGTVGVDGPIDHVVKSEIAKQRDIDGT